MSNQKKKSPTAYLNMVRDLTNKYLPTSDPKMSPSEIVDDIIKLINDEIELHNAVNTTKWRQMVSLFNEQIADIIAYRHTMCCIASDEAFDGFADPIAIYQYKGKNKGIYLIDDITIFELIHQYKYDATEKDCNEIVRALKFKIPHKERCSEPNLIPVNNGIFDYDTKKLMSFSPDYVFTSKSKVDYVENPKNPKIHNDADNTDWDIESWMAELSDDTEIVNLLWEILGAIIRPNVPWGKFACFYSNTGNNGKGTLCQLMRNLCGKRTYTSIALSDFNQEFHLESLVSASAIIVDENNVGEYIDKAANLKSVVTGDVITVNRKFKSVINVRFKGFMVQCFNEFPRIKDTSDSFYRRQLFVPFSKSFTGKERKYIKSDYLGRKEVLEYVLWRVLNMNYYELSEPKACIAALESFKELNNPIRQFVVDIIPQCAWDIIPFTFLYDLYKAWMQMNVPYGKPVGRNTFILDIVNTLQSLATNGDSDSIFNQFEYEPDQKKVGSYMNKPELLIAEYNLSNWMNPTYRGEDIERICTTQPKVKYRSCLIKKTPKES